ncbi:hypothetical protein BESB_034170 [Besnoitia besnoiti]|uniref:SRS domain-containing protein n=1 Tax=Besnoitia besnoiti TaxID=94643 RepID=A0A2A9MGB4_BESBE|nr:hypothetical protein BESB_034170 [Besnoitia besnoiti]PFH36959.1 hypothetical protein BESB_034170 [Besnoitia besnoiti]
MRILRCHLTGFGLFFSICLFLVVVAPRASYGDNPVGATQDKICNSQDGNTGKKPLDLVLETQAQSLTFACGEGLTALKPEQDNVFTREDCGSHQSLSAACPGARLDRSLVSQRTYKLTVSRKPPQDKLLYYKCESQESLAAHTRGSQAGVTQKDCIVKITVKGVSPATVVPAAHICVPKETGKDSTSVKELTLEADKQSIDFSCGNEAGAQLTPATSLKKFCADEGCQEQKELSSVWSDAALTTAGSGAATSYTLSIRSERKEDKDIYYKCSVPASNKTKVEEDGATGKEKSCVLKITVKSGETSLAAAWVAVTSCVFGQILLGLLSFWM